MNERDTETRLPARRQAPAAAALLLWFAAGAAAAQTAAQIGAQTGRPPGPATRTSGGEPAGREEARPAPPPAWPRLEDRRRDEAGTLLNRMLHRAGEEAAAAEEALRAMGAAIGPLVVARFSDAEGAPNEALARLLDRVLEAEHAPLLAAFLGDRRQSLRRYVARKLSEFPAEELRASYLRMRRDGDEEVAFRAELALAGIGDLSALEPLAVAAGRHWRTQQVELRRAAAGLRGPEATERLVAMLQEKDLRTRLAALRLLGAAGTRQAVAAVAPFLEATDHVQKREAINALRGIMDGLPPIDDLSVFEGIELAKAWLRRLGR